GPPASPEQISRLRTGQHVSLRSAPMTLSRRHLLLGLPLAGLVAVLALARTPESGPLAAAPAGVAPLDRVPADAGLVVHFRAGDLWNHPAINEIKKAYPKELDKALKTVEEE